MSNKIIVKDHKYYFKIRGLGGVKGDKGDTGPAGPQGPQGPYVDVVAGTTTTLPAGSSAQVTVNNTGNTSVLNFGIPQGLKGEKGDAGTPGAQGPRGFAATVNVGQTTTGEPGTDASVVNAGNEHDAVLKFTIPKGAKGDTGDTGPQGPTGGVKSTVVAELPETGESDKYYLVNRTAEGGTVTTTDGYAQITNDENAGDLTLNKLDGNATQKTYSGKNLLKYPSTSGSQTISGVQFTQSEDGKLVGSGTTTEGLNWYYCGSPTYFVPTESGQYTLSFTGQHSNMTLYCYDRTTSQIAITIPSNQSSAQATGTLTAGHIYQIYFNQGSAGVTVSINGYGQLEKGTQATAYEPYCGGVPSPNPSYPQDVNVVSGAQTVQIVGKNYFGGLTYKEKGNIASYTLDGMSLTITPSSATTAMYIGFYLGSLIPKAEAHLSGNTFGSTIVLRDANNTNVANFGNTDSTRTLTGVADRVFLNFAATGNTNPFTVNLGTLQIELGNQATTFEPYQSQSQEINLGKNLADPNNANIINAYIRQAGITAEASNRLVYYKVEQNSYYTISATRVPVSGKESVADNMQVALCSDVPANGVATYDTQQSASLYDTTLHASFTVYTGSHTYLALKYANATNTNASATLATIQLERGNKETPFSPYKTPIELCKIGDYQDYIYKSGDDWYIHKAITKLVLNGSENWSDQTTFYAVKLADNAANSPFATVCDRYTYGSASQPKTYWLTASYFRTNDLRADLTTYKTWLSTHNTTVYYALATPTDTEITDSELIAQLDTVASLFPGVNNIWIIPSSGAQAEFTGDYVVYDKYNKHQVYIWSSDDNTWQIIVQ